MVHRSLFSALLLSAMMGCATPLPVPEQPRPEELEARRHLSMAESFEKASAFRQAAFEYTFVAENYPSTSTYPEAVRKAALLYSTPSSPVANETSALRWLQTYLALPLPEEERRQVELHVALLKQIQSLKSSIAREENLRQKLSVLATQRGADLLELAKRVQELEIALEKATREIQELKEVDLQTSRVRAKK